MNSKSPIQFTHSHQAHEDGSFSFACSTDPNLWPWLALSPFDPIVVQTLNYYAAYESAVARGHYKSGQWTALTCTAWRCGQSGVGHAVKGQIHPPESDSQAQYRMSFFDKDERLVYTMDGDGVVFKNRDFEAWRHKQKSAMPAPTPEEDVDYLPVSLLGLNTQIEGFITAPIEDRETWALVGAGNGFYPTHPYHDGSGDHVNASHLADAARQLMRLTWSKPDLVVLGGEMTFERYVELNQPFRLKITADAVEKTASVESSFEVSVEQGGERCSNITLYA